MNTGTYCTLVNKRQYNDDEATVLLHFFTNIDKNVYCATNNMSNQLRAFLVGQYSRSELSMRDRFLELFADMDKAKQKGMLGDDEYISLAELATSIREQHNLKLDFFEKKSADFLKKWGVEYGHNSLKDADRIRFAIEGVSQIFTKIIESPYPTLGDFQEKSTRYLHFGKESLVWPPELEQFQYGEEIKKMNYEMMDVYEKSFSIVKKALIDNDVINEKDFSSPRAFENTLNAKCFDIVRYLLPANVATSLGASFSTRTLETHLSWMMSHPLSEARTIAAIMHEEALKLSPGLLKHVGPNQYTISSTEKVQKIVEKLGIQQQEKEYKGIDDEQRVKLIYNGNLDNNILASIIFEASVKQGISFEQALKTVESMPKEQKEQIMEASLGDRGKYDRMPRALQHSSMLIEFLMDFGAYRDVQRHRASAQLWQGVSCLHGYDYPEYIDLPGMEEFKTMYDDVMSKACELGKKVVKVDENLMQYGCALGHLVRMSFEMDPGQIAYVIELRTTPQGHQSYRRLFQQVYKELQTHAPMFAKYVRVGGQEQASRKEQEERAEQKRKNLGI